MQVKPCSSRKTCGVSSGVTISSFRGPDSFSSLSLVETASLKGLRLHLEIFVHFYNVLVTDASTWEEVLYVW